MIDLQDWFDIEFSSIPTVKFWDDQEQKILKPLSCLRELQTKWILEFDLPLVEKNDIDVYLDENEMIVVEAKLKERYVDSKGSQSYEYESFRKSVKIPKNIDTKNITLQFHNGRLVVTLPKLYSGTKIKIE